jgi:hypothetical protein
MGCPEYSQGGGRKNNNEIDKTISIRILKYEIIQTSRILTV